MARREFVRFECKEEDKEEVLQEIQYQVVRHELEYDADYTCTPYEKGAKFHESKRGCCGWFSMSYVANSGNKYYIGCSYGH